MAAIAEPKPVWAKESLRTLGEFELVAADLGDQRLALGLDPDLAQRHAQGAVLEDKVPQVSISPFLAVGSMAPPATGSVKERRLRHRAH